MRNSKNHSSNNRLSPEQTRKWRRKLFAECLEDRRLLTADTHGPAGVDVPLGVFTEKEIAALEAVPFDSSLSSKTVPALGDGGHASDVLTFVLDFKATGQGDTTDIFGNVVSSFDVASYGFSAAQFDAVANAILANIDADYFDELVGTVAGPANQDLVIDFVIGDIGTAPAGVTEYYFVQIGTGISGPHSGGTLGVAGGSVVRSSGGTGPNGGIAVGDVVSSVFTDAIVGLGGLSPANALTSGNLAFTANAISGTTAHEIGHTVSLSHIDKAGSLQPTAGVPPLMGTGAIDLPNQDRIGNREFSLSGFDSQNGNAARQHIQQLADALGLHNAAAVAVVESSGGTNVSEDGATDTYTIALSLAPAGPVDISVSADSELEISKNGVDFFSTIALQFTSTASQTVTVRAVDDSDSEGLHFGTLVHAVTATSDAATYPLSTAIPSVVATIADNEASALAFFPVAPAGSLVFSSAVDSAIATGGVNEVFETQLDAGQTVSIQLTTDALQGVIELRDPFGSIVSSATAVAAGESLLIQTASAVTAGNYEITISGVGSSTGDYSLEVLLNAAIEQEGVLPTSNNSLAQAQSLDSSVLSFGGGIAERGAVVGGAGSTNLFFESFPTTTFDSSKWAVTSTATIDSIGIGEPSPTLSARLNGNPSGGETLQSVSMDFSGLSAAEFRYFFERTGGGDSTESGEDLVLQYFNSSGSWIELDRQLGSGADMVSYQERVIALPSDALHANFQFRFTNTATVGAFDDWFIDDISIAQFDDDWYSFIVDEGVHFSLAYAGFAASTPGMLELYDSAQTLLASGLIADNINQTISNFLNPINGSSPDTFFARVLSPTVPYSLVLSLNAGFDTEYNSSFEAGQELNAVDQSFGHVGQAAGAALELLSDFPGPDATGFIPPDPTNAVGPGQVVAAVNAEVSIYDKATGSQLFQQSMSGPGGFFGSVGAVGTVFDPWVIFDDDSQRFFLVGIDVASNTESNVFLAVSQDSTPTGGADWYKYKIDFTHDPLPQGLGSGAHFPDYEKMGVNDDAIFISGNYFPINTGSGVYAGITAIEKAPLLSGGVANILYEEHFSGFSVFPLNQFDSGSTQYFAERNTSTSIRIHAITNVLGTPSRSTFDLTVPAYSQPVNVPQLGGGTAADSIDSRIMTGVWRDGSAYFAHAITDPAIGDGESVVRWYQVDTNNFPVANPTLVQSGNVDPGPGVHAWMPAVAVDGAGNMAVGFALGGPNQFYSAGFTGRLASDPLGSTTNPVQEYASGQANYVANDGSGRNRWGDYSGLAIDPSDDATFWVFNEYASTGNRWDTRIASFQLDPVAETDFYVIHAQSGDALQIETFTPFDGTGHISNLLDPLLELYSPDGSLVASNDNGAGDGKNALLTYTTATSGSYQVRVGASASSDGYYLMSVSGATGSDAAPVVIDTNPDNGQLISALPTTYVVRFSEAIDISSIDASDLTVNNIPALSVSHLDGEQFAFLINPSANSGDGVYSISMAAGAVRDLQGNPLASPLTATLIVDATGPTIVSTSWNGAAFPASGVFAPGPLTFTASFSEDLYVLASARRGPFTPGIDDVLLVENATGQFYTPDSVTFSNATDIMTVQFSSPLPDGNYTLTLLSGNGGLEDEIGNDLDGEPGPGADGTPTGDGNPGGDYFINFRVDAATYVASTFERLAPNASLISTSTPNLGVSNDSSDTDGYTFFAEAGETVSAIVTPLGAAQTMIVDLPGVSTQFSSASPGEAVVLPPTLIPADGNYQVRVSASGATAYEVKIFRNTALELEIGDTSSSVPLAIDDSYLSLGSGRFSVIGNTTATSSTQFTQQNNPAAFVDISSTGTPLNLSDDGAASIVTTVGNALFPAGTVTVSNNGGITAGSTASLSTQNTALPAAGIDNALFVLWDDIDSTAGNVYWQELQVGGIQTLIVQWHNRPRFSNIGNATFQLQLFASGPSLLRYAYQDVNFGNATYNNGASATIGYQQNAANAVQFSFNSASVANGDVLTLSQSAPDDDRYSLDLSAYVGQKIDVVVTGLAGEDLSGQTLQLIDPNGTVVATGVADPLGVDATNFELGILGHVLTSVGNNVYTLRFSSNVAGQYAVVVAESLVLEVEPNNTATAVLRSLNISDTALGFVEQAFLGTLEPDNFPVNTVLDTVLPGVRLSNDLTGGSIYAANAPFTPPTGSRVFAPAPGVASGFNESANGFRADFQQKVASVSIDAGSDDASDVTRLSAYDAAGMLLAEVISSALVSGQSQTLSINRPTADIAFIVAGGFAGDIAPLDNLQFDRESDTTDFYSISLAAGETIVIETELALDSVAAGLNTLDPALAIIGIDQSTVLATDDNGLDGRNARLSFTATSPGTYYVRVSAQAGEGEYLTHFLSPSPAVEGVQIVSVGNSRSQITSLNVTFDSLVSHAELPNAFVLTNIDSNTIVSSLLVGTPIDVGGKTTVELTFGSGASVVDRVGLGLRGNSLANGNYRLDILAANVLSASGAVPMAANHVFGGQTAGQPNNDDFFRLLGDANGDGVLNGLDLNAIIPTLFNPVGYREDLDTNGDGVINGVDLNGLIPTLFGTGRQ
ncbi:MAG: pre-peptidase C-terminal domain-containing protein [Planctomycetales bacterium]|nr:pre-peptidase C-terminal domain-containing protein [Planctomycetales bacterium]